MKLRIILALVAIGLLAGPVLSEVPVDQTVIIYIDKDGNFKPMADDLLHVGVGKRISWTCVQDASATTYSLQVTGIAAETKREAPFPNAFMFKEMAPCGETVVSRPMSPSARFGVYHAEFSTWKKVNSGMEEVDVLDPHWVVFP